MFCVVILVTYSVLCPASEWYENQSIMWCEEGVVISGLLMGLNAIDYNVHMKGDEFDRSVSCYISVIIAVVGYCDYCCGGCYC